jgi:hypothetical protein
MRAPHQPLKLLLVPPLDALLAQFVPQVRSVDVVQARAVGSKEREQCVSAASIRDVAAELLSVELTTGSSAARRGWLIALIVIVALALASGPTVIVAAGVVARVVGRLASHAGVAGRRDVGRVARRHARRQPRAVPHPRVPGRRAGRRHWRPLRRAGRRAGGRTWPVVAAVARQAIARRHARRRPLAVPHLWVPGRRAGRRHWRPLRRTGRRAGEKTWTVGSGRTPHINISSRVQKHPRVGRPSTLLSRREIDAVGTEFCYTREGGLHDAL